MTPWAFVPSPLFGVGPVLWGRIAVRSVILTTAGSGPRNNEKLVFGIRSHGGNRSNPLTVGWVVVQWTHWYTQRYQLLEWERKISMYLDDNDWEPTFDALTAGTYWSLLPKPKTLQCVNWTAFVERCRRALRQDVSQTAIASFQEAEVYERVIDLFPGGYYRLIWSIDAARRIARQHALQPRQIQARNLLAGVVVHDLDFGRIAQVDPRQGTVLFGDTSVRRTNRGH